MAATFDDVAAVSGWTDIIVMPGMSSLASARAFVQNKSPTSSIEVAFTASQPDQVSHGIILVPYGKVSGTSSHIWIRTTDGTTAAVGAGLEDPTAPISATAIPLGANAAQEVGGNLAALASAQGSDATGVPQLAGGTGIRGWLSAIYNQLSTSVAVTGTFWQATQPVSALALPLPANAAQEGGGNLAALATAQGADATGIAQMAGGAGIRGWLSAIYAKLSTSIAVTGTFWQATQPVSVTALPLPAGAGTAANQALILAALGSLGSGSAPVTTLAAAAGAFGTAIPATTYSRIRVQIDNLTAGQSVTFTQSLAPGGATYPAVAYDDFGNSYGTSATTAPSITTSGVYWLAGWGVITPVLTGSGTAPTLTIMAHQ